MKTRILIIGLCIAGLGAGALLWRGGGSRRAETGRPGVARAPKATPRSPERDARLQADAERFQAMLRSIGAARADRGEVTLRPEQELTKVNGVPIISRDLEPFGRDESRQMPRERFEFLLGRAIDRELTLQAARAQHVTLTQAQEQHLAAIRRAALQSAAKAGAGTAREWADVELEVRDLKGRMLLNALAQRAGVIAPNPDQSDVDRYYLEHRGEFPEPPADPMRRADALKDAHQEIRRTLFRERQTEYEDQVRDLLGQLKSAARIG